MPKIEHMVETPDFVGFVGQKKTRIWRCGFSCTAGAFPCLVADPQRPRNVVAQIIAIVVGDVGGGNMHLRQS
ncbi:MAG: hypothetical protein QM769_12025 [Pseudoxanthomonas sp.]